MKRDPNVDRALGELWAISDVLTDLVREMTAAIREDISTWEPAPMPTGWGAKQ